MPSFVPPHPAPELRAAVRRFGIVLLVLLGAGVLASRPLVRALERADLPTSLLVVAFAAVAFAGGAAVGWGATFPDGPVGGRPHVRTSAHDHLVRLGMWARRGAGVVLACCLVVFASAGPAWLDALRGPEARGAAGVALLGALALLGAGVALGRRARRP